MSKKFFYSIILMIMFFSSLHLEAASADTGTWENPVGSDTMSTLVGGTIRTVEWDRNGTLYVGGRFTSIGGSGIAYLAKWNGSGWEDILNDALVAPIEGGAGGMSQFTGIEDIAFDAQNRMYVSGYFDQIAGVAGTGGIAMKDGTGWHSIGGGLYRGIYSGPANQISVNEDGSRIWAAGEYFGNPEAGSYQAYLAYFDGTTWHNLGSLMGTLSASPYMTIDESRNSVYAFKYIASDYWGDGSEIKLIPNVPAQITIARFNLTTNTWETVGGGLKGESGIYQGRLDSSGNLIVAGTNIADINNTFSDARVARYNLASNTWEKIGVLGTAADAANGLVVDETDHIYVAGSFTTGNATNDTINHLAKWNSTSSLWEQVGGGIITSTPATFRALSRQPMTGNLFVAGSFQIPYQNLAVWRIGSNPQITINPTGTEFVIGSADSDFAGARYRYQGQTAWLGVAEGADWSVGVINGKNSVAGNSVIEYQIVDSQGNITSGSFTITYTPMVADISYNPTMADWKRYSYVSIKSLSADYLSARCKLATADTTAAEIDWTGVAWSNPADVGFNRAFCTAEPATPRVFYQIKNTDDVIELEDSVLVTKFDTTPPVPTYTLSTTAPTNSVTVTIGMVEDGEAGLLRTRCSTTPFVGTYWDEGDNSQSSPCVVNNNTTVYYQAEDTARNISEIKTVEITNIIVPTEIPSPTATTVPTNTPTTIPPTSVPTITPTSVPTATPGACSAIVDPMTQSYEYTAKTSSKVHFYLPSGYQNLRVRAKNDANGNQLWLAWGVGETAVGTVQTGDVLSVQVDRNNNGTYDANDCFTQRTMPAGIVDNTPPTWDATQIVFTPDGFDTHGKVTMTINGANDSQSGYAGAICSNSATSSWQIYWNRPQIISTYKVGDGNFYCRLKDNVGNVSDLITIPNRVAQAEEFVFATDPNTNQATASVTIDSSGGSIIGENQAAQLPVDLFFPTGAVSTTTQITASTITLPAAPQFEEVTEIKAFSLNTGNLNQTFNTPYTMVINYENILPQNVAVSTLKLYYRNNSDNVWHEIPIQIDPTLKVVVATLNHFTDFLLVGTQAEGNALINVQSGGAGAVFDELVSFVPLSLTGSIQTTTAASTTPWLVVDPTGTGNGWHINLNSTDFVSNTNHTIPVNGFEIKIADDNISEIAGNQKPVSNIPVYTVLNPLDTKVVSAAGETGMGSYNFVPEFRLTIPASTYAGNYVATVTSSFISAP